MANNASAESHVSFTRRVRSQLWGAEEDLQRVAYFVRSRGLSVEETSIPRRSVVVSGTVAQFNDAFAVELGRYELPDQTYRGREGSIYMPAGLAEIIESVFGLDNRRMGGHNSGGGGLNPSNLTLPQVAGLYNFPPGNANGQTIGILEMVKVGSGYRPGDIQAFFNSLGAGLSLENDQEVVGDICVASAVAQGAKIAVYFTPCSQQGYIEVIARMVHPNPSDPTPSVLSTSWYLSRGDDEQTFLSDGATIAGITELSRLFQEAASLQLTVFAACGDKGSDSEVGDGKAHVQYPGSDPWVTSCGGTTIVSGSPVTEVTWNDTYGATGGGVSDRFPFPSYQSGAGVPNSVNDNQQRRGVPDIAGNASPNSGYVIPVDGTSLVFGGTSAVAPLYAGLIAVINATVGRPTGFLNPTLYALSAVSGVFKDINDRTSNARSGAPGYTSGPGWDAACTGWGSINGITLLTALEVVRVRVHIDRILDHVPGTPEEQALVNPYAKVKMGEGLDLTLVQDGDFEGFEKEFTHLLTVPIEIEIWRNTSREVTKHGRVETINGQRFIVFGPHEKYPVPPGWDKLTPTEQAHLTTIIISHTVPPGFVRSLTFTYDLITHQVRGDATGGAGQQIHVPPDPSNPLTPEMWFTISQD